MVDDVVATMFQMGWRNILLYVGMCSTILVIPYAMLGGAPSKSAQTSAFIGIFFATPVTVVGGVYGFFTGSPLILGVGGLIHMFALLTCEQG